jgi:hypothetical protein
MQPSGAAQPANSGAPDARPCQAGDGAEISLPRVLAAPSDPRGAFAGASLAASNERSAAFGVAFLDCQSRALLDVRRSSGRSRQLSGELETRASFYRRACLSLKVTQSRPSRAQKRAIPHGLHKCGRRGGRIVGHQI